MSHAIRRPLLTFLDYCPARLRHHLVVPQPQPAPETVRTEFSETGARSAAALYGVEEQDW